MNEALHRYKAFISYAHEDEAFVTRLHQRLERFVVPKALRRSPGERRLGTLFRDRDELASGGNLSTRIVQSLHDSEYLIVVCSDAAADSRWVNREIEVFTERRGLERVLLIVADSVPRGDIPFPPAMGADEEYLAADARPFADGGDAALLKIVAGLLDVPFDNLVQRERTRHRRRALALASVATAVVFSVLTGKYLVRTAEQEAAIRREQAAAFVGLFVDNLQDRIERFERVGELDADLARALDFFATVDPSELDPDSLEHYRTALLGIGTVRIRQGKPDEALDIFHRARELSRSMVDRNSDQAGRWYDLATHTYYIGEAHWEMQEVPQAAAFILESLGYAQKAAALDPGSFDYQIEVIFGLNNVGAVNTRLNNYGQATDALLQSIEQVETLRLLHPERQADLLEQEVEAVSWLAEITQKQADYDAAFQWHDREIELRRALIDATGNPHHIGRLSDALGYYAQSLLFIGETRRAVAVLSDKVEASQRVVASDPDNAFFRERLLIGQAMLGSALFESGSIERAHAALDTAATGMEDMLERDMQPNAVRRDLIYVSSTRAYMALRREPAEPLRMAADGMDDALATLDHSEINPIILAYYLRCASVLSAAERLLGRTPSSRISDALTLLETHGSRESSTDLAYRVILLHALRRHVEAELLADRLTPTGFRPVFYTTLLDILQPG